MLNRFSSVWLSVTLWTVAHQAPLSEGFSRQESWSGLPFPSPGYLPNPGIKPGSPTSQADALPSEPPGKPASEIAQLVKNVNYTLVKKKKKVNNKIKYTRKRYACTGYFEILFPTE